jgi:hypothetical protein
LPTDLPRPKRKTARPAQAAIKPKPSLFGMLLNTFMVGSVLVLVALVLLQEKRFADGTPGTIADAFIQKAQAAIIDSGATEAGDSAAN